MQNTNFKKENLSFLTLFALILAGLGALMSACQPKVLPTSAGVATSTKTPTSTLSPTMTVTNTGTITPATSTNTATNTSTATSTNTATATLTATATNSPTVTNTGTLTVGTSTNTATVTTTSTFTATLTNTATNTATMTTTNTPAATPLSTGSIAFTSWARNGNAQIGFVATSSLPAGAVIYFTNLSWDATANSGNGGFSDQSSAAITETVVSYTVGSGGLSSFTPVYFGNTSNCTDLLQGGALANIATFFGGSGTGLTGGTASAAVTYLPESGALSGSKIIAFTVNGSTSVTSSNLGNISQTTVNSGAVTFASAILYGPETFTTSAVSHYYDSALPPGLTSGTNAIDLSQLWTDSTTNYPVAMQTAVAGGANVNATLDGTACPATAAGINTASNWRGNILAKTKFILNPLTGAVSCSSGFGFAATPTVVLPF